MAAMTSETWGRHKPPRHCTEARTMKVYPGTKIYNVRFEVPFDGFKAKQSVRMYHMELVELLRNPGVRVSTTEVNAVSQGDVLLDGVTYRFGHEIVEKKVRNISARVGAIAAAKLAVPPRNVKTKPAEGEGTDPTEDERREEKGKQPKSKREAESELKPKRKRRKPRRKPQEVGD